MRHALLLGLVLAIAPGARLHAQSGDATVRFEIATSLMPDSGFARVHTRISMPAGAIPASGELLLRARASVLHRNGGPPMEGLRITDENGRPLAVRPAPDSLGLLVRPPHPAGASRLTLQVEHVQPLDSSDIAQLGYYLFGAFDSQNTLYVDISGLPDSIARFKDFDVTVRYPAGWTVLTSGVEQSRVEVSGVTQVRYAAPHIEGFALALGKGFTLSTVERAGVRVVTFSPPALQDRMRLVAEEAAQAIAWYRGAYGFFPVAQIGIVPGVTRSSGGFPMSNLFMIHRGDLSPEFIRWITAHELGHYYWGLYTLDPEERLGWLVLANSIWADHLYLAQRMNVPLEVAWRSGVQANPFLDFAIARAGNYEQRLGLHGPAEDSLAFDYNSLVRHGKAAVGVYLLAREMPADSFLALQRGILRDYRYRVLPESAFVARLQSKGVAGARTFIDAWKRGDARVGYTIESVSADSAPNAYVVKLARTGTVSTPVQVELRSKAGDAVRHTFAGSADGDSATIRLHAPIADVRLDPDGALPMWESSNPGVKRLFIRALYDAGERDAFLDAAEPFVRDHPDSELSALMITRLFRVAAYDRVASMVRAQPALLACDTRASCRATILASIALARNGSADEARRVLARIKPRVSDFAAERQWTDASAEVEALARGAANAHTR